MITIGYYTRGTPYEAEAERFAKSCIMCGQPFFLRSMIDSDSWHLNTALKPNFILHCLREFKQPILYVDVDAVFHENCVEHFTDLEKDFDFAVHWLKGERLLSGTLWFNKTQNAYDLLSAWIELNQAKKAIGDCTGGGQRNLWEVIDQNIVRDLRMHNLPGRYCYAFRRPECYEGEPKIIEHLLASRENRDASKGKIDPTRQARIAELVQEGF